MLQPNAQGQGVKLVAVPKQLPRDPPQVTCSQPGEGGTGRTDTQCPERRSDGDPDLQRSQAPACTRRSGSPCLQPQELSFPGRSLSVISLITSG